jgi:hypothetical protein
MISEEAGSAGDRPRGPAVEEAFDRLVSGQPLPAAASAW